MITLEKIKEHLSDYINPTFELNMDTHLSDLGLDSLDILSLLQSIEDEFDVQIDILSFAESNTIEDFMKRINCN